jgi:zinc protease
MSAKKPNRNLGAVELQREVFDNGVILLSNAITGSDTVAISGSIKAGAICDEPGKFGAGELVSRVLIRGTKSMSSGQISQRIEEAGATLSFDNRDESVGITSRCYVGVLDEVLEILSECLMHPNFQEKEMDLARNEILAEIKAEEDDTRSIAARSLSQSVFGVDAPYGRNPLGKAEELRALSSDDLILFHQENYSPDRLIIAITGGYNFDTVKSKIDKTFSGWSSAGGGKFHFSEPPKIPGGNAIFNMKHKTQVDIAMGTRGVARSSHDYYPLSLGNLILGRLGLYGRLGKKVRDESGLAYYSYSTLQSKLFSGLFAVYAGVNPSNLVKAKEAIIKEIKEITSEPISQEELETAKRNSLGALSISLDTSVERVAILHEIEYNNLGLDYLERIPAILDRVSSEEILAGFQKYVNPDSLSTATAGPVPERILSKLP